MWLRPARLAIAAEADPRAATTCQTGARPMGAGRAGMAGRVMGRLRSLLAGILIGLLIGLVLLFGVDLIALVQLALGRLRAST